MIDGVNLLPYINDSVSGVAHENLFISRYNNQQSAVRLGKWKYMYQNGTGYQLYDLQPSIGESNNVVADPANAAVVEEAHQLLAGYHVQMDKPRHDNQAPATNQFDHFRFREDALATASFSTANAWVNGDTGTGVATASWRDGYANNELTFRAKAGGDYTVTNDLNAVGGLAYMANQINLASGAAPLVAGRQATIAGLPVMLTKSLAGEAPEINLDATDSTPRAFTFNVDHAIEVYDDLTIQGDGNQVFKINGKIREFRPGRGVTKTGSSELTLGGGVDITGVLDVQGGKVAFANGQVSGDLLVRSGASISVGGQGFNETQPPPPGPPIVTAGLDLNFDAMQDLSGDASWTDAQSGQSLAFASPATTIAVSDATFPTLRGAYSIPTTGGAQGLSNYFESAGPRSQQDATFEVWFHVSDAAAGGDQVLFEAGGSDRGISLLLNNDTVSFNVNGEGTASETFSLSKTIAPGWRHMVGVIDLDGAGDSIALYVDNTKAGELTGLTIGDWAGGNPIGLGEVSSSLGAGGSPIAYHDAIAVARYYNNVAFGPAEVNQNYLWAQHEPAPGVVEATVLSIGGDYTQQAGATLELDLLDPATHDAVVVSGPAALAGDLNVTAVPGFAPSAGDEFVVIDAEALNGRLPSRGAPLAVRGTDVAGALQRHQRHARGHARWGLQRGRRG